MTEGNPVPMRGNVPKPQPDPNHPAARYRQAAGQMKKVTHDYMIGDIHATLSGETIFRMRWGNDVKLSNGKIYVGKVEELAGSHVECQIWVSGEYYSAFRVKEGENPFPASSAVLPKFTTVELKLATGKEDSSVEGGVELEDVSLHFVVEA